MIRMERINTRDRNSITYRGTMDIGGNGDFFDPIHITTQASLPVQHGSGQSVDRRCVLIVVDDLVKLAHKKIVKALMQRFEQAGSFDTTLCMATTPEYRHSYRPPFEFPEQLRGRATRRNGREAEHYHLDDEACTRRTERTDPLTALAFEEMRRSFNEALSSACIEPIPIDLTMDFKPFKPFQTKRDTPARRAMALLARKIGKARYRALKKKGYFEEQGKHGRYQFHKDKQGGVVFIQKISVGGLKERMVSWDLCVQSQALDLPNGDVILSRWLEWKADEDQFLATANFRNIRTVDEANERPVDMQHISAGFLRALTENTALPPYMLGLVNIRPEA